MAVNWEIVERALAAVRALSAPVCEAPEPIPEAGRESGFNRAKSEASSPRQIEGECWHCSGALRCACISCAEDLQTGASGECVICHGTGKALAWVQ